MNTTCKYCDYSKSKAYIEMVTEICKVIKKRDDSNDTDL